MPRIVGQLIDVEQVAPYANRQTGQIERAGFQQLHVLEGREVFKIRMPATFAGSLPSSGSEVTVEVSVRPYVQRGGQSAGVSYTWTAFVTTEASGRRVSSVPSAAAGS